MISIIIPVYNQADNLKKCLESIEKQSDEVYEIIIIDDGSTDGLDSVYEEFKGVFPGKIFYLKQANQGASAARNRGAKLARGDYLLFCDADLEMKPDMLSLMKNELIRQPSAGFCYSSFYWGKKKFKLWPFSESRLKKMPYIHTSSLIRKKDFPETGFDETLKRFQDWDLWLTMAKNNHPGVWLDKVLYRVNLSGRQTMSHWLPAWAYRLLPFLPAVRSYKLAKNKLLLKHGLK